MNLNTTMLLIFLAVQLPLNAQDFERSDYQNIFVNKFVTGDFDGDGNADIFGIDQKFNKPSDLFLFKNRGEDTIAFEQILVREGYDTDSQPLAVDFDQDGDLDVIVSTGAYRGLVLFSNNGDDTFEEKELTEEGGDINRVADIDQDGDLDLVSFDSEFGYLTYIRQLGDGSFHNRILIEKNPRLKSLELGDLNGDGFVDIVLGFNTSFAKQISAFYNDEGTGFDYLDEDIYEDDLESLEQIALADMNQDGKLDIIAMNDETVMTLLNQENDFFGRATFERQDLITYEGSDPFGFTTFTTGDYNGDNQLDFAISVYDEGINWYENTDKLALTYEQKRVGGVKPTFSLANADFDGDGDIDLLASNGDLWWFENQVAQIVSSVIALENTKMRLFPNPFTDYFQIKGMESADYQLELIDLSGKTVLSKKVNQENISIPNLPNGVYQLNLIQANSADIISTKLVKIGK